MTTNKEGLTFNEWFQAANRFGNAVSEGTARRAWHRGEDPTEYAAQTKKLIRTVQTGRL